MDYQLDSSSEICNDEWNIFLKSDTHFIHLNAHNLLSTIDEIHYIAKLTNATVTRFSETKCDNAALNGDLEKNSMYDLVRFDRSRSGIGVACFIKNVISYNRKPEFCINTESIL